LAVKRIVVALLLLGRLTLAQDSVRSLSILHSNDLHAQLTPTADGMGGFAYLAAAVRHEREGCAACIYLNAGDLVQGTPVSTLFHGEPVYQLANLLGFDAGTLGNHEFDYASKGILKFARIAHFPLVSANVTASNGKYATEKGYVVLNVGGVRVGVIGAVMGDLAGTFVTREMVEPWKVGPVLETVRRTAREIKDQADLIVALMHVNETEAAEVLAKAPEIGVTILGHVHEGYAAMKQDGHRYAVEGKAYGVELGRLNLRFDLAKHEIVDAEWKRIPVDSHRIAPVPDVQREVAKWESKVSHIVDVPIGEAKRALSKEDLAPMIEQAMAEAAGADFGFVNAGEIRTTIPAGRLLARKIWEVIPFDNGIVTGRFRGSELPAKITARHPVDPGREYRVVVSTFNADNQATALGGTGLKFSEAGPLQRDALLNWVKKKKVLE
jgi:5'-nucleotidase/UDP-sugar diphosphatase